MGIFDFLKNLIKKKEVEEIASEKLAFPEIESWIKNKINENNLKEKEIVLVINEEIKNFINELKEKIITLNEFDVKSKKEKEDIKNIVINSREKYIELVKNLTERLDNLKEPKLEKFIEKINKIFFDFNKSSFKNYEKATILIGKEMASIKQSIKVFSKHLLKIFDENKFIIDSFKNLLITNKRFEAINHLNKTLEMINEKKSNLNKKINEKEKENKTLKQTLEKIKTSQDYLENLSKQKKIRFLKEESKKDLLELKQLIDFKALANFFHIFEKQMIIVKNHREDFHANFEKDNGTAIINLLNEAKLSNNIILEKINQIQSKTQEIENNKETLKKDETQEINFMIKNILTEIDNLKIEKLKEEKREEKLKTSKEELINSLKQELNKMNVEVI